MRSNRKYLLFSILFAAIIGFTFYLSTPELSFINYSKRNKKLTKAQRIDEAYKLERQKTIDPNLGYIPSEKLVLARQIAEERRNRPKLKKSALADASWTERGPDNVGGRTRALLWDPNVENKVWAGSVSGGLWYNNDITSAGTQWVKVNDFWDNIMVSSIAVDPNNSNIWYIGTGEDWRQAGTMRGQGVFKTTDAGATWELLQSSTAFYFVDDIVVRNEGGQSVLYVAVDGGPNEKVWHGVNSYGMYRSTDGGLTFTNVGPTAEPNDRPIAPADIEIGADNRLWVGSLRNPYGDGGGIIMYSDDGTTWVVDSTSYGQVTNVGRVELACAPSDANVLYALIEASNAVHAVGYTNNKGASWTDKAEPNDVDFGIPASDFSRGQAWYDLIIQVHPTDPNTAYCGGIDLFKTTNGANSWTQISLWAYNGFFGIDYVHADQHQIQFNPNDSNDLIFGTDGGVFYTNDAGANMHARNNGYNVTQFYACAINPNSGSNNFMAGAQDNGTQRYTSAGMNSTTEASGGDGAYTHIDQNQAAYQYTSYVYNNFYRSTNSGSSFSSVQHENDGHFINPSDFDDNANIMYSADKDDLYLRWNDAHNSSSFTEVSLPELGGKQVSAVTASPHTANRVFFGSEEGILIRVDNAHSSPSATVINTGAGMPTTWINCIEIDPTDENHILVVFTSWGIASVWETTDGGTTWSDVEGDLPDMPIRWALFNPHNTTQAILATDVGVWSTDLLNGNATQWEPANNNGLANVRTDMLKTRTSDNLVIAATHGRGLWSTDIFQTLKAGFTVKDKIAYVNKSIQFIDGSVKATSWDWNFGDGTSSTSQNPTHAYALPGTYTVSLTINGGADSETETNIIHVMPSLGTPYTVDTGGNFESNPDHFDSQAIVGNINTWERGTPGNFLTTVNSGSNVWKTRLTKDADIGTYSNALYTPSFNFTKAGSYSVQFMKSMEASGANAPFGAYMEYTTDNGVTWTRLGSQGDGNGTNWYDQNGHSVVDGGHAWTGNYNNELTSYDCSFLAGNSSVAFRFVYSMAKGYVSGYNHDGFMIDDFQVLGETNDTSLPVELTSFTVQQIASANTVKIEWVTESELENAYWIVERAEQDMPFEEITRIDGKGTVSGKTEYIYIDEAVHFGQTYQYRVIDVSFNGVSTVHSAASITVQVPSTSKLAQNYPNPFNPSTRIDYTVNEAQTVKLNVYNVRGQLVSTLVNGKKEAGSYSVTFNASNLASGIYIYRLQTGSKMFTKKMTLIR